MTILLPLTINRSSADTLAEQIRQGIAAAIASGVLVPGARLPSWRDLAAQLGVARGTVRIAYERLADAQLVISSGQGGTRVAPRPPPVPGLSMSRDAEGVTIPRVFLDEVLPAPFQMGLPAQEFFPEKLVARIRARAARNASRSPARYPDPRGEPELRREIAAHLAIARGIACSPDQVLITSGFGSGLNLTLRVLGLEGRKAWLEDPGYPLARRGLELGRMQVIPVPVDAQGMNVVQGMGMAGDAALAVVTPGQQAPLGPTLSLERRIALLNWATASEAWIIEDDYLGELQLKGRAAPALLSLDQQGRTIHLGSFSKTLSPTLRLGFAVLPQPLVNGFVEAAACFGTTPEPAVQMAVAELMRDGHYLRHLRRSKRIYAQRSDALVAEFTTHGLRSMAAGLAVLVQLPPGVCDEDVVREAHTLGLSPAPLSRRYLTATVREGLLLNVGSAPPEAMTDACAQLCEVIWRLAHGLPPATG